MRYVHLQSQLLLSASLQLLLLLLLGERRWKSCSSQLLMLLRRAGARRLPGAAQMICTSHTLLRIICAYPSGFALHSESCCGPARAGCSMQDVGALLSCSL